MNCEKLKEELIFSTKKNASASLEKHLKVCSNCKEEYQKNREIVKIMTLVDFLPSKHFFSTLPFAPQKEKKTSFLEKITFFLDYCVHRCIHSPMKVILIFFLMATVVYLPLWYLNCIEQFQTKQQALPIWKIPAGEYNKE